MCCDIFKRGSNNIVNNYKLTSDFLMRLDTFKDLGVISL